ncbi:hypothetical protein [Paracidovorax cattleyae]|nr:hypothetical protein [Paracidovorax cattleyae]
MFHAVEPEIDEQGIHFICPGCGARNPLVNVAQPGDDDLSLGQPDE